jgi:Ca2+-binding RTX toxin-like protein
MYISIETPKPRNPVDLGGVFLSVPFYVFGMREDFDVYVRDLQSAATDTLWGFSSSGRFGFQGYTLHGTDFVYLDEPGESLAPVAGHLTGFDYSDYYEFVEISHTILSVSGIDWEMDAIYAVYDPAGIGREAALLEFLSRQDIQIDASDADAGVTMASLWSVYAKVESNMLVMGSNAADTLVGGAGDDTLSGSGGADLLAGRDGDDVISGGGGNDVIWAGSGHDTLFAGSGDDKISAGHGNDEIRAGSGHDVIYAFLGDDTVYGDGGDDQIWGGDGADSLDGGGGNDVLWGGRGADLLYGSGGNDSLRGRDGSDTFIFSGGNDLVIDFDLADSNEKIDLSTTFLITDFADLVSNHLSGTTDAVITDAFGYTLTLVGINPASLVEGDFIF